MQHYTQTTTNPNDYSVAKDGTKWAVMFNGLPLEGHTYINRKRDAVESITEIVNRTAYRQRIMAEDDTGHIWTADESKQIAEYAEKLRENKRQFTMSGYRQLQDSGRAEHFAEIHTITSHYGLGAPGDWSTLTCAEIRRRRAARTLAFKQAGAFLDNGFYRMTTQGIHSDKCKPYVTTEPTAVACIESIARTLQYCIWKNLPDKHENTIEYVPAAWPIVCRFDQA